MRSEDIKRQEREKRNGIYGIIAMIFVFLILVVMVVLSFTGGGGEVGQMLSPIITNLKEIFENVWFKISNFFDFLIRGFKS